MAKPYSYGLAQTVHYIPLTPPHLNIWFHQCFVFWSEMRSTFLVTFFTLGDYLKNLCTSGDPACVPCTSRLPSCDGLPDGNQPYPGREWQADYVNCYKNRTVSVQRCSRGFFHPQQKHCVDQITPSMCENLLCHLHETHTGSLLHHLVVWLFVRLSLRHTVCAGLQ